MVKLMPLNTPNLNLSNYKVDAFRIDRGTIILNNKYFFNDHVIQNNRRETMDYLYLMKTPMRLSYNDYILILSNKDTIFTMKLRAD